MDVRRLVEEAEAYGRSRDVIGNIIRDNVGSIIPGIKTPDPYQSVRIARPELVKEPALNKSDPRDISELSSMRFAGESGKYRLKERDPSNKVERLPDKTEVTPSNVLNSLFSKFSEKIKGTDENVKKLYNIMEFISGTGGAPMIFESEGGKVEFSPQGNIGFRTSEIPGNPYVTLNPANKEASIMFAPEQNPLNPRLTLGINPEQGVRGELNFSTRF